MAQGIQIGKVAEHTGLSIDTIRFYQKIGLVKQPARSEGGFRLFSEKAHETRAIGAKSSSTTSQRFSSA